MRRTLRFGAKVAFSAFVLFATTAASTTYDLSNYDVTVKSLTCVGSPCGTGGGSGASTADAFITIGHPADLTAERALAVSSELTLTDGGVNSNATLSVTANGITNAMLRTGAATSVVGRSAGSGGNVADIAASADGDVLRRSAGALGFGAIPESSVTNLVSDLTTSGPVVVDVNPAEVGSTTQGFAEALTRVNASGGIMQLRCNTTYTLPSRTTWPNSATFLDITKSNVWIRGCGASSVVTYTEAITTAPSAVIRLFNVGSGINNVMFTDFKMVLHDTCTSGCGSLSSNAQIFISGTASYVIVERMQLYSTEDVTSDATNGSFRNIYVQGDTTTTPDSVPRRVFVMHNDIQASNRAIEFQFCDHCWAMDNYINFLGKGDDSTTPGTMFGIIKYEGVGVQLVGNIVKMGLDGYTNIPFMDGVALAADNGCSTSDCLNVGARVVSNTFDGLRSANMIGVAIDGYDAAEIANNFFNAGMCHADNTKSCYVDEDCSAVGGVCDPGNGLGVAFVGDAVDLNNRNRANVVTGNNFKQFNDDNGNNCPVWFSALPSNDPNENSDNIISDNNFWTANGTDDGFCGTVATRQRNRVWGNHVVGSGVVGGVGNNVEVSININGGAGFYSTTVTGQSWVTPSSVLTCSPFGTTADGGTPELTTVAAFDCTVSDRVAGTGFKLNVWSPNGADGTFRFHVAGS